MTTSGERSVDELNLGELLELKQRPFTENGLGLSSRGKLHPRDVGLQRRWGLQEFLCPVLPPEQLQQARRASGRLGGRSPRPTVEEARQTALKELVPESIKVLKEHLESDRPDTWRAALRVLEHAWGRPNETVDVQEDLPRKSLDDLNLEELLELRDRLLTQDGLS